MHRWIGSPLTGGAGCARGESEARLKRSLSERLPLLLEKMDDEDDEGAARTDMARTDM
jgi:hypothetical protein